MCKFTNRLFVFTLLALLNWGCFNLGAPIVQRENENSLLELLVPPDDYDLHYDQRQKGGENFRLKLDGFFIGLPAQDSTGVLLLTDDLLENLGEELLLGLGKSRVTTTSAPENALAYRGDLSAPHKKLNSEQHSDTFVVEIPAPKREFEARNRVDQTVADDPGSRTKLHIYHLLNLLRRSRRE